jgi:hypothetical protein
MTTQHVPDPDSRLGLARANGCYSCPEEIEAILVRLGSLQCHDCRAADQPISSERFLALGRRVVDGIDMAAVAEQLYDVGPSAIPLDRLKRAA